MRERGLSGKRARRYITHPCDRPSCSGRKLKNCANVRNGSRADRRLRVESGMSVKGGKPTLRCCSGLHLPVEPKSRAHEAERSPEKHRRQVKRSDESAPDDRQQREGAEVSRRRASNPLPRARERCKNAQGHGKGHSKSDQCGANFLYHASTVRRFANVCNGSKADARR